MPLEFSGAILPFRHHHLLIYGPEAHQPGQPAFGPPVFLRPGYHLFYEPDYLLPVAVIDDRGQRTHAPDCYDWIEQHGDLFPRADAIGRRPSGQPQTCFMKELDLTDMAVFAAPHPEGPTFLRVDLALEVRADVSAPTFAPFPLAVLDRAMLCYAIAPGPQFSAHVARILNSVS